MIRTVIAAGDDDAKTLLSIKPADSCGFKDRCLNLHPCIIVFPNIQQCTRYTIIIHSERDRGLPLLSSMIGGDIVCELESHNLQACAAG